MNIRVDLETPITDGREVVFRSPVDCSQVTGLIVYYNGERKEFAFADAHGNNVGDIDHLFAENVAVKVILDLTTNMAFVQNADTNAYLEQRIDGVDLTLPHKLTEAEKAQARANIGVTADGAVLSEADKREIAGMVDLNGYPTTEQVQGMINTAISNIPDYTGEVEDV